MLTKEALDIALNNIQNGQVVDFEKIYDAYSPALYGIALKIVKDNKVAEDVVQDTFVKIWKKIQSFDQSKGSFFTWILNIARNTAIDQYRKLAKVNLIPIQTNENFVDLGNIENSSQKTDNIGIVDLLKVLPEEQQQIITYLYFKGFTQQELSDELNIPLGTVKTRSRSAIKALKELFIILATWI